MTIFLVLIIVTWGFWTFLSHQSKKQKEKLRKEAIYAKYGRTDVAEKILNKVIWVGETVDQIRDSLGAPNDIDEMMLKTKKKETWKYYPKSRNRFGLKILVENNIVVGWDEKL